MRQIKNIYKVVLTNSNILINITENTIILIAEQDFQTGESKQGLPEERCPKFQSNNFPYTDSQPSQLLGGEFVKARRVHDTE